MKTSRLKLFCCGILGLVSSSVFGQNNPKKIVLSPDLQAFVPKGFVVMDTAQGDLNQDQKNDLLLALKRENEAKLSESEGEAPNRPLILLTRQPDNTWKRIAQNDKVLPCLLCGGMMGDPYQRMVVNRGFFTIESLGGSREVWQRYITFKYIPTEQRWVLHRLDDEWNDRLSKKKGKQSKREKDFGKIIFEDFDVNNF